MQRFRTDRRLRDLVVPALEAHRVGSPYRTHGVPVLLEAGSSPAHGHAGRGELVLHPTLSDPRHEPTGAELERLRELYFESFPDGRERQSWRGITYIRARPTWIRYSDFTTDPPAIIEFERAE